MEEAQFSQASDLRVSLFRRVKRVVRRKIGWNKMPMRYQMRIHLFLLSSIFLICYLIFMWLFTKYIYVDYLFRKASERYETILTQRLTESSIALSTVVYNLDKIGIEAVLRLTDVFERVSQEVAKGYYVGGNDSIPNYRLYT